MSVERAHRRLQTAFQQLHFEGDAMHLRPRMEKTVVVPWDGSYFQREFSSNLLKGCDKNLVRIDQNIGQTCEISHAKRPSLEIERKAVHNMCRLHADTKQTAESPLGPQQCHTLRARVRVNTSHASFAR